MAKLLLIVGVALVTAAIVWFVTTTSTGEAHDLQISGAYSAAPLLQRIAARYQLAHPADKVAVRSAGSDAGLADVEQGRADVGLVARDPTAAERARYRWYPVARDAVAVVVHGGNPVTSLSRERLGGIFTGRLTDWSAVGGPPGRIDAVAAAEGSGIRDVFGAFISAPGAAPLAAAPRFSQGVLQAVAADPAAIGYASYATIRSGAGSSPIKALNVDGVAPAPDSVEDRRYPLVHGVYLVVRGQPAGIVDRFVRYAASAAVQDLVRDSGFFSHR